jgi:hypothetical protein
MGSCYGENTAENIAFENRRLELPAHRLRPELTNSSAQLRGVLPPVVDGSRSGGSELLTPSQMPEFLFGYQILEWLTQRCRLVLHIELAQPSTNKFGETLGHRRNTRRFDPPPITR